MICGTAKEAVIDGRSPNRAAVRS